MLSGSKLITLMLVHKVKVKATSRTPQLASIYTPPAPFKKHGNEIGLKFICTLGLTQYL